MKKMLVILALLYFVLKVSAQNESSQFTAGIVYGPKAAFKISAPDNWILDNKAGLSMGLPCVLYIDGYNWQNSPVIMYAKIASTDYEDIDKFVEYAIKEFLKVDPNFKHTRIKTNILRNQFKYYINDYQGGPYNSYERVMYIQMEKAVGYVVFSARNLDDFEKYADAIYEIVHSFEYEPEFIDYKE